MVDGDVVEDVLNSEPKLSLVRVMEISSGSGTISSGRLIEISVKSVLVSSLLIERLLLKTNAYETIEIASNMLMLDTKLIIDFAIDKLSKIFTIVDIGDTTRKFSDRAEKTGFGTIFHIIFEKNSPQ